MRKTFAAEDVVGIECRHAVFIEPAGNSRDDYHLIKERVHLKDKTSVPNIRVVKNYKRPYYLTREAHRKYTQHKEWEHLSKLQKFECKQSDLVMAIAKSLGQPWFKGSLKKLCCSPYVFGADITSTALIKQSYLDKWPGIRSKSDVSVLDIETDVVHGTEEIIMTTLSFRDKIITSISKKYLGPLLEGAETLLRRALDKYLGEYVEKRGIKWEIKFADSPADTVMDCFQKAHEWQPDFVAIWNIDFDLPKMVTALQNAGVSPADVFCDPIVPPHLRFFKYVKGATQKVTASGKITPIKPSAQWHVATVPASFYFIDAMCAYRQIRVGGQEEPSYSLDAILQSKLGTRKLKFKETDHLSGLPWHIEMQSNFKIEYVIYNVFDCIGVEELDEKTLDLCLSLDGMSGCSDYGKFNSQPRRLVDDLHHYVLKNKDMVIGTTGDDMEHDFDKMTIGLNDWIVMLPAANVADNGLCIIEEDETIRTNIRAHTGDLDVSASYPSGEVALNISRGTTCKELISIAGVDEFQRRMQGINLSGGPTNGAEFCQFILNAPQFDQFLRLYMQETGIVRPELVGDDLTIEAMRKEINEELGYVY